MMRFEHSGLECMTRISPIGVPCGYVGLDREHPYFEKNKDEIPDIEVHGGLSFAGYWEELHDGLWYIGFDVCHAEDYDYEPSLGYNFLHPRLNKSMTYVEEETKHLAEQMAKRR